MAPSGRCTDDVGAAGPRGHRGGNGQVEQAARDPQRLEVGDGAARGKVPPGRRGVEADHARELVGDLELQSRRDRSGFTGHVVRVVEHRGEVADLCRDRRLTDHVTLVASAEEGHIPLQLGQQ